jgi:hypothetical protein
VEPIADLHVAGGGPGHDVRWPDHGPVEIAGTDDVELALLGLHGVPREEADDRGRDSATQRLPLAWHVDGASGKADQPTHAGRAHGVDHGPHPVGRQVELRSIRARADRADHCVMARHSRSEARGIGEVPFIASFGSEKFNQINSRARRGRESPRCRESR